MYTSNLIRVLEKDIKQATIWHHNNLLKGFRRQIQQQFRGNSNL